MPSSRMPIEPLAPRPGRHRHFQRRTGTAPSVFGPVAGRHRAATSPTGRRNLAAFAVAAGLVVGPALTTPAAADSYTVRSGDTLAKIAQGHDTTTWRQLYRLNRDVLSSPSRIYVGQSLELSRHGRADGDRRGGGNGSSAGGSYTVRRGDTLSTIAQRFGMSWRQLYRMNGDVLSDPSRIYAGQRLDVRGGGENAAGRNPGRHREPSHNGSFAQQVLAEARRLQGIPYVYGGASPAQGFDCSGFTSYAFRQAGKTIPRTSAAQAAAADRISSSQLRPGDLVFYHPYGRVSHVAIYAGNGMVWEAPGTGKQVQYAPLWDVARFYGRF